MKGKKLLKNSFIASILLAAGSTVSAYNYIIDGDDVSIEERPYQVSLQNNNQHFCGGAIIGTRWVLTAAHCIDAIANSSNISVLYNTDTLSSGGQRVGVRSFYYSSTFDIGLIQLNANIPSNVERLKLPDQSIINQAAQAGSTATVSGWGRDENFSLPDTLQGVDATIVSSCTDTYTSGNHSNHNNYVCTTASACFGDSGGPLTVDVHGVDYSIGVVSHGTVTGFPGCLSGTAVYGSTIKALSWINSTIASAPVPGVKVCEFNDPSTGTTPGCTQSSVGGGGGTIAYSVKKNGQLLMYVEKYTDQWSWPYNSCQLTGSSANYYVSGDCNNYRVYTK